MATAEFSGIKLLHDLPVSTIEEDEEKNDNEEVAAAEQNCKLVELPQQNEKNEREGDGYLEGDPNEPDGREVIEAPVQDNEYRN